MIIKAKLIRSLPTETIKEQYKKYSIEVETDEKYPQPIQIIAWNADGLEKLKKLQKGKLYEFYVNIKGSKWQKPGTDTPKFFHDFDLWKAVLVSESHAAVTAQAPLTAEDLEDSDDLPF